MLFFELILLYYLIIFTLIPVNIHSHLVSCYLHCNFLYSYHILGIISIIQCYKIDIKKLSNRDKISSKLMRKNHRIFI